MTVEVATLRPHQARARARGYAALRAGRRAPLFVSPTGSGKTRLAATIAADAVSRGRRVAWLAHRRELVAQASDTLALYNVVDRVACSSYQAACARGSVPDADIVIFDECHHLASREDAEWKRVVDAYAGAIRIGLTATPERFDGSALAGFDALIEVAKYSELIAAGYLVPCRLIQPPSKLESRQLLARPVDAYLMHAPTSIAVVYGLTVEECDLFAADFRAAGIVAEVVHGKMPDKSRDAVLARWRSGETRVVVNCSVLTEGFDYPALSTIILGRGCGSVGLYIQIGGRGARPYCPCGAERCECPTRKREYLLIDLSGASWDLGNPTEDRVYSLEGRGIQRAGVEMPDVMLCNVCGEAKPCGCPIFETDMTHEIVGSARDLAPHIARIREEDDQPARVRRLVKFIERRGNAGYGSFRAVYGRWPTEIERAIAMRSARVAT